MRDKKTNASQSWIRSTCRLSQVTLLLLSADLNGNNYKRARCLFKRLAPGMKSLTLNPIMKPKTTINMCQLWKTVIVHILGLKG